MARRRQLSRGFAPGPRRLTAWSLGPGADDLTASDNVGVSTSATAVLGSGVTPVIPNLTIVRIRGTIEIRLITADASLSGFAYASGIGVFSSDAFVDVGATALPDPMFDADWPGWMWHQFVSHHTALGALAVGDPSINPLIIPIDTKSMRKFRLNDVLGIVFQSGEAGTAAASIWGTTRVLVKLP